MLPTRKSLAQFGLCLILSVLHISLMQAAQDLSTDPDFRAIRELGRSTFNSSCAVGHGLDGRGSDKAPNISGSQGFKRLSDAQMFSTISNGVAGTGMPAFHAFKERRVRAVIEYLRSLQGKIEERTVPGDAKRGKEVFFGKGDCSSCHTISGKGGFLGPDLTAYGATGSATAIRDKIVKSPRVPSQGNRLAALTTASGDRIEGLVRNEDN